MPYISYFVGPRPSQCFSETKQINSAQPELIAACTLPCFSYRNERHATLGCCSGKGLRAWAPRNFGADSLVPHVPRAHDTHTVPFHNCGAHGSADVVCLAQWEVHLPKRISTTNTE